MGGEDQSRTVEKLTQITRTEIHGPIEKLTQINTVMGNVLIQVAANEGLLTQLMQQVQVSQRKVWRPLEVFKFPPLPCLYEENEPKAFSLYLAYALRTAYQNEKYVQFTGLFRKSVRTVDGMAVQIYELFCHQVDFLSLARDERTQLLTDNASRIKEALERGDTQDLYDIEGANFDKLMAPLRDHWNISWEVVLSPQWIPLEITYDRATKSIAIKSLDIPSIDLENFPGKLRSTSELLKFIAATLQSPVLIVNDADSFRLEHPSAIKMFVDMMDHRQVFLDQLRINVNDYEEWDYLNPQFDAEIERLRAS
jgi:hypothetical protein